MPNTVNRPKSMTTAKKPASKRKVTRRILESPKAAKASLQTLQTGCRGDSDATPPASTFSPTEKACFGAIFDACPFAVTAGQVQALLGLPLPAVTKALLALAARGDILKHADAPDTQDVKWKAPYAEYRDSAAAQEDAELRGTVGYWVFENRGWPRYFELPGLAGINQFSADDVIHLLSRVIHEWEDELHALAARHAHKRPNKVAELAEVMAICEQIVCAGGLATDLDDTPIGGTSPRLLLAALAKQQSIVKRPRTVSSNASHKGGTRR